jgi:hypothetical protein
LIISAFYLTLATISSDDVIANSSNASNNAASRLLVVTREEVSMGPSRAGGATLVHSVQPPIASFISNPF